MKPLSDVMKIHKGNRHQKIIGEFGEHLVCNWFSRSGFEVTILDYVGIDILAYNPRTEKRYGISVKSRTRLPRTETESVYVFRKPAEDREKLRIACKAFGCDPWIAVYVESTCHADLYLTSLTNYDLKYRPKKKDKTEGWATSGFSLLNRSTVRP